MTSAIAVVLLVLLGTIVALVTTRVPVDAVLVAALLLLLALPVPDAAGWRLGVISATDGFAGFANPALITVGVLFVVAAGLRETGAVDWIALRLFGRPRGEREAMVRLMAPVAAISAFLNNTPLVAMLIPAVQDWAKRLGISPSRLLIPLSYAAILGGTCTLIGTSTNLVVAGLVAAQPGLRAPGMFDIAWVGVPTAIAGIALLVGARRWLLPERGAAEATMAAAHEYMLTLVVPEGSALIGRSIDDAGLRHLPGCFLISIERADNVLAPVGPEDVLRAGDRLAFAGVVEAIRELVNTRGLSLATDQVHKLDEPRHRRRLFEAVVAPASSLAGSSIRQAAFRTRFHGAVIAVGRNGERMHGRLGDVRLRSGDLLLVEADQGFGDRARASGDFLLVRSLADSTPRQHHRAPLAIAILLAMVAVASFGVYPMVVAGSLAAAAMVALRCCSLTQARRSVDFAVLTVIGASLGIGAALQRTGAAAWLAESLLSTIGDNPWLALAAVYAATTLLTEIISNSAAVALTFPIAQASAADLGVDFTPFVIAIMMAGSASFATPIGYQTNLMVYGPGKYTFGDFLRAGVPMNVLGGLVTVLLAPLVFPFRAG